MQESKLGESISLRKLLRMLQSMSRRYPNAKLHRKRGAIGVYLGDDSFLSIRWSGELTSEDMRDLLALYAVWFAVDPERVGSGLTGFDGSYSTEGPR